MVTKLWTFRLIDDRHVTYAALSERHAFRRAYEYHGAAVDQMIGRHATPCACPEKAAEATLQNGWRICRDCAGYVG